MIFANSSTLRVETLRRAAEKLNMTTGPGLEEVQARISAEVMTEAASRVENYPSLDSRTV